MKRRKPHIVLMVMDTARAANFSCYGYERETSPNIDAVAAEGILFKNAISPSPWTLPSHMSLFTGLYPTEHGMTEDRILEGKNIFGSGEVQPFEYFLPQILKNEGYKTVGFSNNPWVSKHFGFHKGFDIFYEGWKHTGNRSPFKWILRTSRRIAPQMFHPVLNNLKARMQWLYRSDSGAFDTVKVAKEWFSVNYTKDRPFFVFFNFMEPHLPYIPPRPFDRKFIRIGADRRKACKVNQDHLRFIARKTHMDSHDFEVLRSLYDGEIAYLDSKLEEILDYLHDLGMRDQMFLVITSDHGENIGEHSLMGHQFCLYDTLLRVPLVIKSPYLSQKGLIDDKYVQLSDVFHTILDVLDIKIPGQNIRKRSLLNPEYSELIIAEHEVPEIALSSVKKRFADFHDPFLDQEMKCLYHKGKKYIWNFKKEDELFDIEADPGEEINLIDEKREQAGRLSDLLKERIGSMEENRQKGKEIKNHRKERIDKDIEDKLRDLGYI